MRRAPACSPPQCPGKLAQSHPRSTLRGGLRPVKADTEPYRPPVDSLVPRPSPIPPCLASPYLNSRVYQPPRRCGELPQAGGTGRLRQLPRRSATARGPLALWMVHRAGTIVSRATCGGRDANREEQSRTNGRRLFSPRCCYWRPSPTSLMSNVPRIVSRAERLGSMAVTMPMTLTRSFMATPPMVRV